MTDLNKEREAFEQHLIDIGLVEFAGYGFDVNECDEYTHEPTNVAWGAWVIGLNRAKAQAVLDTQQKLTDTYYLEGSDYVVDCPFEYDIEIDKGEVLELQKWQRTESTKVYFANIYEDEDNFEILQFASKAEAENAVAENLKFLEASESGAEG
ncbi:Uncharacterised protein [Acinetobacter phage MD-2021a]|uniref:hypothetical protein n=1 Tax=Acinetobacter baumannii TaxID=470 RepID=UPI000B9DE1C0|nr:hypothetical protein [Acinetobacter baumannii]CAH1085938.1 Uncharacterised protein [Acinetobacter phage MD-2021a]EHU1299174.1 hypothetical protein [Acinetobacter baumannii]MCJ9233536.1 hypothetical protein [Acinetobacter baumannii]OZI90664.1 hypothetical protein CFN62_06765 [Acinetobacter baumannii]TPS31609.1 hypothetical protein FJV08_00580 [Acinetobacter baumannii]